MFLKYICCKQNKKRNNTFKRCERRNLVVCLHQLCARRSTNAVRTPDLRFRDVVFLAVTGECNILGKVIDDHTSRWLIFRTPCKRLGVAIGVICTEDFTNHCYTLCLISLIITTSAMVTNHLRAPYGVCFTVKRTILRRPYGARPAAGRIVRFLNIFKTSHGARWSLGTT